MNALRAVGRWIADVLAAWRDPFDVDDPDSDFPGEIPEDADCPTTQPTNPGALEP